MIDPKLFRSQIDIQMPMKYANRSTITLSEEDNENI